MLISKFDLYKDEWLDLVFDDRNKNYGAYELRQHYANTMVKAMVITFSVVGILCAGTFILKNDPGRDKGIVIDVTPPVVALVKPPETVKPKPAKPIEPPKASAPQKTVQNPPMVAAPDNQAKT